VPIDRFGIAGCDQLPKLRFRKVLPFDRSFRSGVAWRPALADDQQTGSLEPAIADVESPGRNPHAFGPWWERL